MSMLTACGSTEEATTTDEVVEDVVEDATEEDVVEDAAAEDATEEDATEDVAAETCSDETFAALQENYAAMTDAYNAVVDAYNSDEVEADADIEATLNSAQEVITEMGEITQDTITEEDADTLNQAMLTILDALQTVVDAM